jgi:aminoglycoside 3'-phosphotransferase-2
MSLDFSILGWTRDWVAEQVSGEIRAITRVRSNEVNEVFRLAFEHETLFLKIGPGLQWEWERLRWLEGRLPAPRPLGWTTQPDRDALLMTAIEGDDLAFLSGALLPQEVIVRLSNALKQIHRQSIIDWPFGGHGTVLVHGDACLPNFLYSGETFCGYIDVGDMTLAGVEVDLAAAVWTLERNLGPGYGLPFLREYGWEEVNEAEVERLRLLY